LKEEWIFIHLYLQKASNFFKSFRRAYYKQDIIRIELVQLPRSYYKPVFLDIARTENPVHLTEIKVSMVFSDAFEYFPTLYLRTSTSEKSRGSSQKSSCAFQVSEGIL
jgi:hypothetical protein